MGFRKQFILVLSVLFLFIFSTFASAGNQSQPGYMYYNNGTYEDWTITVGTINEFALNYFNSTTLGTKLYLNGVIDPPVDSVMSIGYSLLMPSTRVGFFNFFNMINQNGTFPSTNTAVWLGVSTDPAITNTRIRWLNEDANQDNEELGMVLATQYQLCIETTDTDSSLWLNGANTTLSADAVGAYDLEDMADIGFSIDAL